MAIIYCQSCKVQHPEGPCPLEYDPRYGPPPAPGDLARTPGYKLDAGKLRYDLIPPHALEALAYVYTIGANKYGDDNYLKGMSFRRVISAAFRHIAAWQKGRMVDPDDGQHPLASVAWCMFTLMEYERLGVGVDDRRP